MKGKISKKIMSLLLAGILTVTGMELPVYAAGGEPAAGMQLEENMQDESEEEAGSTVTQPKEEAGSIETQPEEEAGSTEIQSEYSEEDTAVAETLTEQETATAAETETDSTDDSAKEGTDEAGEETTEQESFLEMNQEELLEREAQLGFSVFVVNPRYEGILDYDQIEAQEKALQNIRTSETGQNASETFGTVQEAAVYVRGQMVKRAETVVFNVPSDIVPADQSSFNALAKELVDTAIAHTEGCTGQEGDALAWGYRTYGVNASGNSQGWQLTFSFTYHSTYEQEQELTKAVNDALQSMALEGKSDYQKIRLIHDYICDHVDYDYDLNKYSAYDAMCTGKAVCQGYAVLFYRMCKDAGLSVRLVSGTGKGGKHGWNIVKISSDARAAGMYYNIDCTWDGQDAETHHTYFLKNEEEFTDHQRDAEYATSEFHAMYPMSETSYDENEGNAGLNIDNLSFTLYDLNEEFVSTAADKKTKILIFYGLNCAKSQQTIRSIRDYGFQDVDICAIAGDGSVTKEQAAAFKKTYGSEDMVFTYGFGNANAFNEYADIADSIGITVQIPVICYIDSDNKLQHITCSTSSGSTVADNIKKYCGSKQEQEPAPTPTPEPSTFPQVNMTISEGNILMGVSGSFDAASEEKILKRLNEIRLEACKEGVKDPATGNALTEADYKPLQWSSDLEAITRLRAAEAAVRLEHTRPNGQNCFSVMTTNGEQSWAENLAWNYNDLMKGIEQWYGEKSDWVNQTQGKVTGHYESIISTRYNYVAVSAFKMSKGYIYPVSVAQEFSYKTTMDSQKCDKTGECVQDMEIAGSAVSKLTFETKSPIHLEAGSSYKPDLNATAGFEDYGSTTSVTGPVREGGVWKSSNEAVASVDANGNITAIGSGTADISVFVGAVSAKLTVEVYRAGENPLRLTKPDKTTYKTGEQLDLTGGAVTINNKTVSMTKSMVSGFSSETAGISKVTVTYNNYSSDFEILVVEEPKLNAQYGQTLSQLQLPVNEYGVWSWADEDLPKVLDEAGVHKYRITFTPNDLAAFQKRTDFEAQVSVQRSMEGIHAVLKNSSFVYNGTYHEPEVIVTADGSVLTVNEDYTLEYNNNKNAGIAQVAVTGKGSYEGTISINFEIKPARLVITAEDRTIAGTVIPDDFKYKVTGLAAGERLITEPSFTCNTPIPVRAGVYDIIPQNAKATTNYDSNITYVKGRLIVAEEQVAYIVTFDVQGHGTQPDQYIGNAGAVVEEPREPAESGYIFAGWYQDAACTKAWNFETDILQSDLTLYAKWLVNGGGSFNIQEIADVYYTGKPCKPSVSVYNGDKLLKPNKDYKITYGRNTDVNAVKKTGNGMGNNFDSTLPYITITGKGNYTASFSINFNILPAPIGDADKNPVKGVTLSYTDQLILNAKKTAVPFKSIKYGKALKKNLDYKVSVKPVDAFDSAGVRQTQVFSDGVIPAGYTGSFVLQIEGVNNYSGIIEKPVYVLESAKLIKNAKITVGKNIKSVKLKDYGNAGRVELVPAYYDKDQNKYYKYIVKNGVITLDTEETEDIQDCFMVTCGGESLRYMKDYKVTYEKNDRTGTASMTIVGIGYCYAGSKTVSFKITGEAFKANTVAVDETQGSNGFKKELVYTGKPLTQNGVKLTFQDKNSGSTIPLVYGKDYTISYRKNLNKGTATMTFKAMEGACYSGSFSRTFKILAADINDMEQDKSMENIEVFYEKAGAKPVDRVLLKNKAGSILQYGRDYTVSYKNINAVASASAGDSTAPTMIIKGKGNYTGMRERTFTITKCPLDSEHITTEAASAAYNKDKAMTFEPAIKVKDKKSALKASKDYGVEYLNNSSADFENYLEKMEMNSPEAASVQPRAVITALPDSNYAGTITVPLPVYRDKLTAKTLYVVVGQQNIIYTGQQLRPDVKVYYSSDSRAVSEAKKMAKEKEKDGKQLSEAELTGLGLKQLRAGEEYTVSYGANVNAGKNKGSVVIRGKEPYYGGSVTEKFTIQGKEIYW